MSGRGPKRPAPADLQSDDRHGNFSSFTYGDAPSGSGTGLQTPRIEVTGEEPAADGMEARTSASPSAPSDAPQKRRRFVRNAKTAASRRMEFLSFSSNFAARSLDEGGAQRDSRPDLDMKPLSFRARSLSPLKQMRTYSSRLVPSEESVLTAEASARGRTDSPSPRSALHPHPAVLARGVGWGAGREPVVRLHVPAQDHEQEAAANALL